MVQDVRITGTGTLLELQRRLRAAGHENIRSSMQRRIRRAAEPLRDDLKDAISSLSISSPGGRGRSGPSPTTRPLRATIADAIRISVRASSNPGARIWVDKGALPPDLKKMPDTINTGRIRHPVFGNRSRWATQYAAPGWWTNTVRDGTPRMNAEVSRVLDDVRQKLD